jgi:hypothetical protein
MRISTFLIILFASNFAQSTSLAENGVPIEPGEWEMTSITTSDTLDVPNVQTASRCISLSEITALDLTPNRGECQLAESSVTDNKLHWKVACNMTVGTMHGTGTFESNMNSGSGIMDIIMDVQNDQFELQVSWKARRLGACK